MEPAFTILMKLGGAKKVASYLGIAISVPYRWTYERKRGGTDGYIPARQQPKLLEMSREIGAGLTAADFFVSNRTDARTQGESRDAA